MITDELVSFETAKLAKEKGFDVPYLYHYDASGKVREHYEYDSTNSGVRVSELLLSSDALYSNVFLAPTQSLLQRWLREEKGVIIELKYSDSTESWRPFWSWIIYNDLGFTLEIGDNSATYEQALEDALKYSFENLV